MDILVEIFNTLSAIGNNYTQFVIAQIDNQDSVFVKVGLGIIFSLLPVVIPYISAKVFPLRLSIFHVLISLFSYLLLMAVPTYLLNHYFLFLGYIWAFMVLIYSLVYLREIYEYFFLALYLLTKRNEFLNFIGYLDLEHYMMYQVAKEVKKRNKSEDSDEEWWRKQMELWSNPIYSFLVGNIHHRR